MTSKKKTTDALEILAQMRGEDPELSILLADAENSNHIAQLLYDAREQARLSQSELAKQAETPQSVISQLEDADYNSCTLATIRRVAKALGFRVELQLVPIETTESFDAAYQRATEAAHDLDARERRAKSARYVENQRALVIGVTDGTTVEIPVEKIQGLENATTKELAEVKVGPQGRSVHWELLEVDLSATQLIKGVFGSVRWMEMVKNKPKGHRG